MALSTAGVSITGRSHFKSSDLWSTKLGTSGKQSRVTFQRKSNQSKPEFSIRAQYKEHSRGGGGDFLAGFLLGGAVFGTLAYVFAPQIRRSILNEDEYGFRRAKGPIYYDEGLEMTSQTLNAKISQLNSAIDNVSSRLRGGIKLVKESKKTDSEIEAAM